MTQEEGSIKEKIIKATWELFFRNGYDNTTVDDIITLAGTSKGSFYYYFEGKDALLHTLSDVLDDQYRRLEKEMDPQLGSIDKLLLIDYEVHRFMEDHLPLDLIASLYSTQLTSKGDRTLLDQNRKYYRLVRSIIEEGQTRGEIRKDRTISELLKYYTMCERALVTDWCLNRASYSLTTYSKDTLPLMLLHFRT
ncbi:AcrR family transcriptional regulator [Lachnospiraceae bacterium PF1-22]|uniref:TetR/AcrR family transcriptional regulator n=1 Tax=Ohessyouella blattaphilus TaxID=2949333 RepID=UPI003E2F58B5